MRVSSTEFQQHVGRYQDLAQREPVTVTKNGRDHTVLLSAHLFETILKGRVVRRTDELDEETLAAIASAEVPADEAAPQARPAYGHAQAPVPPSAIRRL